MSISHTGLPSIANVVTEARYNPLRVSQLVWRVERWWWGQNSRLWREAVATALRERYWRHPDWETTAEVAMSYIIRLGAWGAKSLCEWAKMYRRKPPPARLQVVQMAAEINWGWLAGESWEDFKARVFGPLREATFGIASEFCDRYVAERMPPIVGASEELRARVRDVMVDAQISLPTDRELRRQLQAAGNWPLARVRNQIRTETSTMYNAGRFVNFAEDEAVTAYRYVATLDDRTTRFCRAINGKIVKEEDLQHIPPCHYMCRSIVEPLFEWEKPVASPLGEVPVPGEGDFMEAAYHGFGQRPLITEFKRTRITPSKREICGVRDISHGQARKTWREFSDLLDIANVAERDHETKRRIIRELAERLESDEDFQAMIQALHTPRTVEIDWSGMEFLLKAGEPTIEVTTYPWLEGPGQIGEALMPEGSLTEKVVSGLIKNWSHTSGDEDSWAIALQLAVKDELPMAGRATMKHFSPKLLGEAEELYSKYRGGLRSFVRAQYENTQAWLAKHEIDEIIVYRGAVFPKAPFRVGADYAIKETKFAMQPASSFSTDPQTAAGFSAHGGGDFHTISAARMPAHKILGTAQSGWGCKSEAEIIVAGGEEQLTMILWDAKKVVKPTGGEKVFHLLYE